MKLWNILDVGSIWMKEFGAALSRTERVQAWVPRMQIAAGLRSTVHRRVLPDPPLEMLEFPLQRGYARHPLRWLLPFENSLFPRLLERTPEPQDSPLICSTPFYAPLAERWPGPVVYYATDLVSAYEGLKPAQVKALERRMCVISKVVCPNSNRIARFFVDELGCDPAKIVVIPNATRASNVAEAPRYLPDALPPDASDLPRPVAGVLGDLSGNMDWELIAEVVKSTPQFSWLFVGPTTRRIADPAQHAAREWTKANARFVGMKPYRELQSYARSVDVAVLPYRKKEPTFSGSSTRFYEHLAAGRPMVATHGFAELLEKKPLLSLVETAEEMLQALALLKEKGFQDGYETMRWNASKQGTWEERAQTMRRALQSRLTPDLTALEH